MFNIKKIIIIAVVVMLAFVAYSMITGKGGSSTTNSKVITKQSVAFAQAGQAGSTALDGPGKEFVTQLLAIQSIKFNLSLFDDPVYKGLRPFSKPILPQEVGRPNPFAPLDTDFSALGGNASLSGSFGDDDVGLNISTGSASANSSAKTATSTKPAPKAR